MRGLGGGGLGFPVHQHNDDRDVMATLLIQGNTERVSVLSFLQNDNNRFLS